MRLFGGLLSNGQPQRRLICLALVICCAAVAARAGETAPVRYVNVARKAGLTAKTVYGDEQRNRYLLETTGSGAAFFDYDADGWQDIFLVNGTRLDGPPKGETPT